MKENNLFLAFLEKIIRLRKLFTVVFLSTFAVALIFIHFYYSKPKTEYVSLVRYDFDGIEEGKYPDGTSFDYLSLISYDVLENVKNNGNYSSVNLDKLLTLEGGAISIKPVKETIYTEEFKPVEVDSYNTFEFVVDTSCFPSYQVAKSFITDLIAIPVNYASSIYSNISYNKNLILFNDCQTYEEQVNLIKKQRDLIYQGYQNVLDKYGNKIFYEGTENAFSISECIAEVRNFFYENPISSLEYEIENKGYVKNPTFSIQKIDAEIEALLVRKEDNKRKIDELTALFHNLYGYDVGSFDIGAEIVNQITSLITENVDIDRRLEDLYVKRNNIVVGQEASEDFLERLNMFYSKVSELTDTYTFVARNTNKANVYVTYNTPAHVLENGGLTLFIELLISTLTGAIFGISAVFFKKEG